MTDAYEVWKKDAEATGFDRMPDIWYRNEADTRMCFWCIDGVWYWRHVRDDGEILAEGEGTP